MALPPRVQLHCPDEARAALLEAGVDVDDTNGIDHIEVIDSIAPAGTAPQRTLVVHCYRPAPGLTRENVRIEGGVRVRKIEVEWAHPIPEIPSGIFDPEEAGLAAELAARAEPERQLVVRTSVAGDFSLYTIRLVRSPRDPEPPAGFDPLRSSLPFSFKVDCPSRLECPGEPECPEPHRAGPHLSYLAKDFASFRRLLLDRLSVLVPEWRDRSPADLAVSLVELLAYRGDHLSYYQDAVATEAYLGTARRRVSARRHARLVGYRLHEGSNARTCVVFDVGPGGDGLTLPRGTIIRSEASSPGAAGSPAVTFETMHDLTLRSTLSEIPIYTWRDPDCCLPRGATTATLEGDAATLGLEAGDLLLFEEVLGGRDGDEEDADPDHRHVVRLAADPLERVDPTNGRMLVEIRWHEEDALPFPLCLREFVDEEATTRRVAVARGNVALADHGLSVEEDVVASSTRPGRAAATLERVGLTYAAPYDHESARALPAAASMRTLPEDALPSIRLAGDADIWTARYDLLASDRFAPDFVVEPDDTRGARIRFGDGVHGRLPAPGTTFRARYRVGGGAAGNVGAEVLTRLDPELDGVTVRNPLPATGGTEPQPLEEVRLYAPRAFRVQERAVTAEDYAEVALRHPEVQRATATRRWTGSWYTWFLTVDRVGGRPIDPVFERELGSFFARFRLAGYDLEIEAPRFVPLDIEIRVCTEIAARASAVSRALRDCFSTRDLPSGARGFFHPDRWTFGQPVYLSDLVNTAMDVPGVQWVQARRFQRFGRDPVGELEAGRIEFGSREIARVDNDPNTPERGRIAFAMEGGR